MKLFYEGKYYLQKFDIMFLLQNSVMIPKSFKDECNNWSHNLRIRNTRDHFTFVGPFTDPESIAWIDSLDYIIHYNDYASSPLKAINKQIRKQSREVKLYDDSVQSMRREAVNNMIQDHLRAIKRQAKKAQQELAGLEIMRDHLEHKIEFQFPDGYEPPTPLDTKKEKIISRFFGHYRVP